MRLFLIIVFLFVLLFLGCASTSSGSARKISETDAASQSTTQSVTVGGEIQVRGQYLRSH